MDHQTTKEKLGHRIQRAETNARTARRIKDLLDRWGSKQFNRRFATALEAELGDGYNVAYFKDFGDTWRLVVFATSQHFSDAVDLWLGERPTAEHCREKLAYWLAVADDELTTAARFELEHYDDIMKEAGRVAAEMAALRENYGKYKGGLSYDMSKEVGRILRGASV